MATVPSRWSVAPWRFSLINIKMIEINCNTGTPNEMTYPYVCKPAVPASNLAPLAVRNSIATTPMPTVADRRAKVTTR